ncbi:hypothetical protein SARC_17194, partial [Sphaeroforma arctica JP610]
MTKNYSLTLCCTYSFDAEKYGSIYSNVAGEVTDLRRVLQSLEAKKHERVWLK